MKKSQADTEQYIDLTPSHAAFVDVLLHVQARPDDCSDTYKNAEDDELFDRDEDRRRLAEGKKFNRAHFLFVSQVTDLVNEHMDSLPEAFKLALKPLVAEYRKHKLDA